VIDFLDFQNGVQQFDRIIEEIFGLFIVKVGSNAGSGNSSFAEKDIWLRFLRKKVCFLDDFDPLWLLHWRWELFEDLADACCGGAFDLFC